jgi:acyl-CoA synthetase (AMP-forming)/AMP-acid ligase II
MYYAASKVGIVPVPLNYRLADAEWEYIIIIQSQNCYCRSEEFVDRVNGFKANLPSVNKCICINAKAPDDSWSDFYDWIKSQSEKILKKILKMMMQFIKCIQVVQQEDLKE